MSYYVKLGGQTADGGSEAVQLYRMQDRHVGERLNKVTLEWEVAEYLATKVAWDVDYFPITDDGAARVEAGFRRGEPWVRVEAFNPAVQEGDTEPSTKRS